MTMHTVERTGDVPARRSGVGHLSRTCGCGRHSYGAARCPSCASGRTAGPQADGPRVALDPALGVEFGQWFGTDLSALRVHTDDAAATPGRHTAADTGGAGPTAAGEPRVSHRLPAAPAELAEPAPRRPRVPRTRHEAEHHADAVVAQLRDQAPSDGPLRSGPVPPAWRRPVEAVTGVELSRIRLDPVTDPRHVAGGARTVAAFHDGTVYAGSAAAQPGAGLGRESLLHELVHAAQARTADLTGQAAHFRSIGPLRKEAPTYYTPTAAEITDEVLDALASVSPTAGVGDYPAVFRLLDGLPDADLIVVLTEVKAEGQLDSISWNVSSTTTLERSRIRRIEDAIKVVQGRPTIVTIGTEQVEVTQPGERAEAENIFRKLREKYGVRVSSPSGVRALELHYSQVPEAVRAGLRTKEWTMRELRALERALENFAPILGEARTGSTRSGQRQELMSVGKLRQSITENSPGGVLEGRTSRRITKGEYFDASHNLAMFAAGEKDSAEVLTALAIHEIAHGLMDYAVDDYARRLDYWGPDGKPSGKAGAEAPITPYGTMNPDEDLAEAVKFYFSAPQTLKNGTGAPAGTPGNPCRKRFALIDEYVKAWERPARSR